MEKIVVAISIIIVMIAIGWIVIILLPHDVSAQRATLIIEALPEVKKYQEALAVAGTKAVIDVEDLGDSWNVHVYEIVSDGDLSHTATFGWYTVNKKTGTATKEI